MKRHYYNILFIGFLAIFGCTQKPVEVVDKVNGRYIQNYNEAYVESPDGKITRSLRSKNDSTKAQEINIIKNDINKNQNNTISNDGQITINKNSQITKSNVEIQDTKGLYKIENGDTLWGISKQHDVVLQELIDLNNIETPHNIRSGQLIKISGQKSNKDNNLKNNIISTPSTPSTSSSTTYIVKSGDNLSTIASDYGIQTSELADLNNLERPYQIRIGQKLKINSSSNNSVITKQAKSSIKENNIYIVKSGDNLSTIANNYDISTVEIANLNNLKKPYSLRVGQKLKIDKNNVVIAKNSKKSTPLNDNKEYKQPKNLNIATANTNKKNSFVWPIKGEIISSFGNKSNGLYNDGINISTSKGSNFQSAEDGIVAYVGNELRGYGTIILIKHNNNWISVYGHCDNVKVSKGEKVNKGQIIGTIGQTGNVDKPQLYFSLRNGREAVDPEKLLK